MNRSLVYTLNLVLVLNCVIIIAKNETESGNKLETNLNQSIFAEGVSEHDNEVDEKKPRIFGRKGVDNVIPNDNTISQNNTIDDSAHNNNINVTSISTPAPIAVHKNVNSSENVNATLNATTLKPKIDNSTAESANKTTSSTAKINVTSTTSTTSSTSTSTSTSTTTTTEKSTTTTKKPIKKPEVTFSADDNEEIALSEKKINYNVANEKAAVETPKVETDVDRSMLDEKRARNSYMIYLGLAVALPMSFVLINIAYKRVKSYLELRHYQRVDFLVDGMYVS